MLPESRRRKPYLIISFFVVNIQWVFFMVLIVLCHVEGYGRKRIAMMYRGAHTVWRTL